MAEGYMLYKVPDFIRKNEKGEIDYDKSLIKIKQLTDAARRHRKHNLLVDLRETETRLNFIDSLMLSLEFAHTKRY